MLGAGGGGRTLMRNLTGKWGLRHPLIAVLRPLMGKCLPGRLATGAGLECQKCLEYQNFSSGRRGFAATGSLS